VLDTCINYPIGYAIGEHECAALIKEALRNAVNHTRELFGMRYRVNQYQSDHYAISEMSRICGVISDKFTPARVKNAKAKPVEAYFNDINERYCRLMPNGSGYGITSRKSRQPNIDALNECRKSFPDREGCARQIMWIMESERKRLREQYVSMFANLPEERRLPLSDEQYLLEFGSETGFRNTIEASGLRVTIEGVKRDYDCFDVKFRQLAHVKWAVKYDPSDKSRVLAVSEDGSYRFMLEEKYVQPMALAERKDGDAEKLQKVLDFNKTLGNHVIERLGKAADTTRRLFEEHANEIDPTLSRLLLCDSEGQHKNRKNIHRGGDIIDIRSIEPDPAPAPEKVKSDEDAELLDLY